MLIELIFHAIQLDKCTFEAAGVQSSGARGAAFSIESIRERIFLEKLGTKKTAGHATFGWFMDFFWVILGR